MIKKFSVLAVFFIFFMSCASNRAVIKQDFDFSAIRTVRVGNFSPANNVLSSSGDAVQSAFIRQLLARGFMVVVDPNAPADAVIQGSVLTFQPERRFLVRTSDNRRPGHWHGWGSDAIEVGGSNVYDLGPAFGMDGRVIASNATVGISAHMTDVRTGKVVWSISFSYEGLDLNSALNGAVRFIVRTLPN
ncbi:MAG: DUF799 domain-containing protein [Endomicrobia bacterium]|nr:DUF799 domain-containing protein [Endomicrobiia bacterium]MCL2507088.1 DUF799 domain-containing protein [Endomicrobiia bacterium]